MFPVKLSQVVLMSCANGFLGTKLIKTTNKYFTWNVLRAENKRRTERFGPVKN